MAHDKGRSEPAIHAPQNSELGALQNSKLATRARIIPGYLLAISRFWLSLDIKCAAGCKHTGKTPKHTASCHVVPQFLHRQLCWIIVPAIITGSQFSAAFAWPRMTPLLTSIFRTHLSPTLPGLGGSRASKRHEDGGCVSRG
jgi:hypothetical protein